MKATGTFKIDSWAPTPYDEQPGATLTRTAVTKTFLGEVAGTSTAELLMAMAQNDSAAYVGLERFAGSVKGRSGTFVFHHSATMSRAGASLSLTIVPDSGTDDLTGITGAGTIGDGPEGGHTFELDYELEATAHD